MPNHIANNKMPESLAEQPGNAPSIQAIKSMTGYGEARAAYDGWQLRVSLRSVNHRFLDLRMRLPEGFETFERTIRQLVRESLRRGHVDVTLHVEDAAETKIEINREIAATYMRAIEQLRREFDVNSEPDLVALLRLPGVVTGNSIASAFTRAAASVSNPKAASDEISPDVPADAPLAVFDDQRLETLGKQVSACLSEALARLNEMREAEGRSLAAEMHVLLAGISEKAERLDILTERSRPAYALRVKSRIEEVLAQAGMVAPLDPAQLAQEAALLAERADVREELARLRSHVAQFGALIEVGGEVGKKLDFLLQEMQREANTLLSKTPALGEDALAVTELGLQIKSDIEKIREQVQNVE